LSVSADTVTCHEQRSALGLNRRIRAAARRVADRLAAVGQRDPELERPDEQPGDDP
jgi:hypothetical protein